MPSLKQAILLGTERLSGIPSAPDETLKSAWTTLDWAGAKETSLLDAVAIAGVARMTGASTGPTLSSISGAAAETRPFAPAAAVALLPRLFEDEWRPLLLEWVDRCADQGCLAPSIWLPRFLSTAPKTSDRGNLLRIIGERGQWLARQNLAWSCVHTVEPQPDIALWDIGTDDERLGCLAAVRNIDAPKARELVARTWADDTPEFRVRVLGCFRTELSKLDEPFLTQILGDRRKDIRSLAQGLLALIPESDFRGRMISRAVTMLTSQRTLLGGRRFEVNLPAAFDPTWKADGIEEKPPSGMGEKAYWTQQILAFVPVRYWMDKLGIAADNVIEAARKSSDWTDLLLGAWYRAATLHTEPEVCAALLKPVIAQPNFLPPGVNQTTAIVALLSSCSDAERWRIVVEEGSIIWTALPTLRGAPSLAQGRGLLQQIAPSLRDGVNPGGSPAAVAAARLIAPALRDNAAQLLTRENGLTKAAERFLQALDLRSELHAAFSSSNLSRTS